MKHRGSQHDRDLKTWLLSAKNREEFHNILPTIHIQCSLMAPK